MSLGHNGPDAGALPLHRHRLAAAAEPDSLKRERGKPCWSLLPLVAAAARRLHDTPARRPTQPDERDTAAPLPGRLSWSATVQLMRNPLEGGEDQPRLGQEEGTGGKADIGESGRGRH